MVAIVPNQQNGTENNIRRMTGLFNCLFNCVVYGWKEILHLIFLQQKLFVFKKQNNNIE